MSDQRNIFEPEAINTINGNNLDKNLDNKGTTAKASPTLDPFDPASLRLGQNFSESLGARKELVVIPVRKPSPQEFIRVLPDENMRIIAAILEWQADREL